MKGKSERVNAAPPTRAKKIEEKKKCEKEKKREMRMKEEKKNVEQENQRTSAK